MYANAARHVNDSAPEMSMLVQTVCQMTSYTTFPHDDLSLEDQPIALSFRSRGEAWDWVEANHPGCSIRCYDNPDGTVTAYLDPPEEEVECCERCCTESPCVMVENQESFEGLIQLYQFDQNLSNRQVASKCIKR